MALDYSPLLAIDPAGAFMQGQERAAAQAERNMLRQMQMEQMQAQRENILAQRQEREAQATVRRAQDQRAADRQRLLSGAAAALRQGGYPLNRDTLQSILASAIETDEPTLYKFATETMKALDEEDLYKREASRLKLPGAAPVNALAASMPSAPSAVAGVTREQVQQMLTSPSARIREQGKALTATLEKPERPYEPTEVEKLTNALRNALPGSPEAQALQARIRILTTREPKEPKEPALRTTKVELADGSIGVMNLDTGEITPATVGGQTAKGKPSAFAEKTAVQRKQLAVDLDRTITELESAAKPKGLIEQSTGSGAGRLIDVGAAFVGQATPGAIAAGKLAPIADMVLKMVPRFEGPQSDKDTKSYKEAAGQLADTTLPTKIRQAAALEIVRLMKTRKSQFATADMAAEGLSASPASGGFPTPPQAAIDALKAGKGTDAQFDAIFGPGAAARAKGR